MKKAIGAYLGIIITSALLCWLITDLVYSRDHVRFDIFMLAWYVVERLELAGDAS